MVTVIPLQTVDYENSLEILKTAFLREGRSHSPDESRVTASSDWRAVLGASETPTKKVIYSKSQKCDFHFVRPGKRDDILENIELWSVSDCVVLLVEYNHDDEMTSALMDEVRCMRNE